MIRIDWVVVVVVVLILNGLEATLFANLVEFLDRLLHEAARVEFFEFVEHGQCRLGVLDRVVRFALNVKTMEVPGEEAQRHHALGGGRLEEVDGVDHLLLRHHQVDHAKVVAQAVPDEDHAVVDQEAQL